MSSMASIVATILIIAMAATPIILATDYTVGDSSGWSTGVDYGTWASDKTFNVGDTLLFQYGVLHSVNEVTKSDYDSCGTSNSIKSYNDQNTKIALDNGGLTRYFICGTPGHCSGGMKLAVPIAASGGSSSPSTPSGSTLSGTPSGSGSNNTPPTTAKKSAATGGGLKGGNALVVVGGSLVVGVLAVLG